MNNEKACDEMILKQQLGQNIIQRNMIFSPSVLVCSLPPAHKGFLSTDPTVLEYAVRSSRCNGCGNVAILRGIEGNARYGRWNEGFRVVELRRKRGYGRSRLEPRYIF